MLLANQTEFLVIKDADRTILRTADEITRLVADARAGKPSIDARSGFQRTASVSTDSRVEMSALVNPGLCSTSKLSTVVKLDSPATL